MILVIAGAFFGGIILATGYMVWDMWRLRRIVTYTATRWMPEDPEDHAGGGGVAR